MSNPTSSTSEWVKIQSKSNHSKQASDRSTTSQLETVASNAKGKQTQIEADQEDGNANPWDNLELDLDRIGYLELNPDPWKEQALKDGNGKDERNIIWLDIGESNSSRKAGMDD